MRFLFVTYCFGNAQGHALVGVYKRGLRIALEVARRGHAVAFACPGRENFSDETTAAAGRLFTFLDVEFREPTPEAAVWNRREILAGIRAFRPDVVVIGEAPLEGFLLEATLGTVELGIPVAVVDNAYNPALARLFWEFWQTMFDGLVLTGPRSFWHDEAPPHVLQIPPFIQPDAAAARDLVAREGLRGDRLVTVLAYDFNVQELALSVLGGLADPALEAVFLTHEIEACRRQVAELPPAVRERVRVLPPQPDGRHFGLLQLARLVIGKCAFMQLSECLSLHTPLLGFLFANQFSLRKVPAVCRQFSHETSETAASAETLAAVRRLLAVEPEAMGAVHDGTLGAAGRAADFLEALPGASRRHVGDACERALRRHYERTLSPARAAVAAPWGRRRLTDEMIRAALARVEGEAEVAVREVRFGLIRTLGRGEENIFAVTAHYTAGGEPRFRRLWLRLFDSPQGLERSVRQARAAGSERRLYLARPTQRLLIEEDRGEALLPSLDESSVGADRPAARGARR